MMTATQVSAMSYRPFANFWPKVKFDSVQMCEHSG